MHGEGLEAWFILDIYRHLSLHLMLLAEWYHIYQHWQKCNKLVTEFVANSQHLGTEYKFSGFLDQVICYDCLTCGLAHTSCPGLEHHLLSTAGKGWTSSAPHRVWQRCF